MAADDLATQETRASAAMVLTWIFRFQHQMGLVSALVQLGACCWLRTDSNFAYTNNDQYQRPRMTLLGHKKFIVYHALVYAKCTITPQTKQITQT